MRVFLIEIEKQYDNDFKFRKRKSIEKEENNAKIMISFSLKD